MIRDSLERAAIAAPTADNSQPWKFHWLRDAVEIRLDSGRERSTSDQTFLLTDLGAGACAENMRLRAATLGYDCSIKALPAPMQRPWLLARMEFRPTDATESALAAAIEHRHTNRSFPWRRVDAATLESLTEASRDLGSASLARIAGRGPRRAARRALTNAEAARFAEPALHAELFNSIRFASGWHRASETGLAPGSLAIEPPLRPLFQALGHWPLMRALNAVGGARLMATRSALLPVACSPALYLLQVPGLDRRNILQAGRALQRFWLAAEAANVALQPFAAPGVIAHGGLALSSGGQKRRAIVARCLDEVADPDHYGLVFARVGRARARPAVRSGRRPPQSQSGAG